MSYQILQGDCIETMRGLPGGSVQTCVTSPPYYGLRDYGTATWQGGDTDCDHTVSHYSDNLKPNVDRPFRGNRTACLKCGALRIDAQIGLEETPDAYVAKLIDVFREVRRLLRDDGVIWVNLGDSYASSGTKTTGQDYGASKTPTLTTGTRQFRRELNREMSGGNKKRAFDFGDCKPKDLVGIPWLTAFALRADGWYLRSDIIWHKPNPMPESVTDRPTKAHEYIFLLSKSAQYYYDADAVREPNAGDLPYGDKRNFKMNDESAQGRHGKSSMFAGGSKEDYIERYYTNGRNRRSVWTVTTKPYSGAHFATFPPDLIEPCILAGSRIGDTVLDPFNGSGTTGAVALKHGRNYIGCELNPDYIELAHERIRKSQPMLLEVT